MYLDVRVWSSARVSFTKNWQSIRKAKERDRAAGADDAARFVFNGQRAYCNPAMTTANKITIIRILMIPAFVLMAIYYGESIKRGEPLEWQRFTAIAIFLVAATGIHGM